MQGKWWGIKIMQTLFLLPPKIGILLIACVMCLPFYFYNKFLVKKIMPRQSGKRLLLYFGIVIASVFIYITMGTYLIIGIAKLLQ